MKKTYYTLTIAAGFALVACGRPSTSNFFELDGVGDPNAPITGNPIPGRWGGSMELTNYVPLVPSYSIFSDGAPFQLSQLYVNTPEIGGLGGWGLLGISTPAPPRLEIGQRSACYMNPATLPLLGGPLESTDLGEDVDFDFSGPGPVTGMQMVRDDDEDIAAGDLLVWTTPFNNALSEMIPGGVEVDMEWNGGTLSGYKRAPPLQGRKILQFPQEFATESADPNTIPGTPTLPTVNAVTISSSVVESDNKYVIEWLEQTSSLDDEDPEEDLLGVELIFTVYGPANFGDQTEYQVADDSPFNTRLAQIVCLVDDSEQKFTIFESEVAPTGSDDEYSEFTLQALLDLAMASGKYETATEDVNGNGQLDPEFTCGPALQPTICREDGNQNGLIDKIHGISLTINRRTERAHELDIGDNGNSNIFISGNNSLMMKMAFGSAPTTCSNGLDDDSDGDIDNNDAGCIDAWDDTETTQCDNGVDDDLDNLIDFGADPLVNDPQCTDALDDDEEL